MSSTPAFMFALGAIIIGFILAVISVDAKCFLGDPFTKECLEKYNQ